MTIREDTRISNEMHFGWGDEGGELGEQLSQLNTQLLAHLRQVDRSVVSELAAELLSMGEQLQAALRT
jgi:hypothetical protein